jgi:hypothetical protein
MASDCRSGAFSGSALTSAARAQPDGAVWLAAKPRTAGRARQKIAGIRSVQSPNLTAEELPHELGQRKRADRISRP